MAEKVQDEGGKSPQEIQAATDRESVLRLQRFDLCHENRMRIKIANEQMSIVEKNQATIKRLDGELSGQESFFK